MSDRRLRHHLANRAATPGGTFTILSMLVEPIITPLHAIGYTFPDRAGLDISVAAHLGTTVPNFCSHRNFSLSHYIC